MEKLKSNIDFYPNYLKVLNYKNVSFTGNGSSKRNLYMKQIFVKVFLR